METLILGVVGEASGVQRRALGALEPLGGAASCWGISGFSRRRAVYFAREAARLESSRLAAAAQKAESSKTPLLLAAMAGGEERLTPGQVPPYHYRDWNFASRQTLQRAAALTLSETRPQGTTVSERLGLWLLEKATHAIDPTAELRSAIQQLRALAGVESLLFVIGDGRRMWAYTESGQGVEKLPALLWTETEGVLLVCTEILPEFTSVWKTLPASALCVFHPGATAPQIQPV